MLKTIDYDRLSNLWGDIYDMSDRLGLKEMTMDEFYAMSEIERREFVDKLKDILKKEYGWDEIC